MKHLMFAGIFLAIHAAASAQDADDKKRWSGEGSFGAGITTGNTDTVDISVNIKLNRDTERWKLATEGGYDFGQIDGVDSRNRWFVSGQANREFSERLFGSARVSYEEDDFSGFDSRLFVGIGGGYHIFKREKLRWTVEISPGFRIDKIADTVIAGPPEMIIPGPTEENFAARSASRFAYDFNENVTFTNDTGVVWTDFSTQTINTAALDAKLTKALSARISFEVRNDTNPPAGAVSTDTASRLSLAYGF